MAYRAAWLIGSRASVPDSSLTINASVQPMTGGSKYLWDANAGLSWLAAMQNVITAAGVAGASCILLQNGKVRISAGALFSVNWGTATIVRDMLGFTANLAANSSHIAPNISPLLWRPGKPESPLIQRVGAVGHRVHSVFTTTAPYSGKQESVSHGTRTYAKYAFPCVDSDLVVGTLGQGGTWDTWFEQVALRSARFKLYREVLEDDASNASVMTYLDQPLGPYVISGPLTWKLDRSRGFDRLDIRNDVEFSCHEVAEYS